MSARTSLVLVLIVSQLAIRYAVAHEGGTTGYATLTVSGAAVRYTLTLWHRTLPSPLAAELEQMRSGDVEVTRRWLEMVRKRVQVSAEAGPCTADNGRTEPAKPATESVTVLFHFTCREAVRELHLRDDVFDVLGRDHHTVVRIDAEGHTGQVVALTPDAREARIALPGAHGGGVIAFVGLGIEHILTGYDHLLFLAALLLGGGTALHLLKIVTAFTGGHSLSLAAAVFGLVSVPVWLVESVIAGSIAWVAIENVIQRGRIGRRWVTALAFGLVHGLGFASALGPLDLPPWNLAGALLGFNIGVETGQAGIIAVVAPTILWLGGRATGPSIRRVLSLAVATTGIVWLVARVLGA